MSTQSPANGVKTSTRGIIGACCGAILGGLSGWLIDCALTEVPYAGIRIGAFIGGMCGMIVGNGTGRMGAVLMFSIVLGSVAGVFLGFAIWNPEPNSHYSLIPAAIGGMLGAFVGLFVAATLVRRHKRDDATKV